MKIQVNQGRSIQVGGAWFDQRSILDVADPTEYGDAVTLLEAKPVKTKNETKKERE